MVSLLTSELVFARKPSPYVRSIKDLKSYTNKKNIERSLPILFEGIGESPRDTVYASIKTLDIFYTKLLSHEYSLASQKKLSKKKQAKLDLIRRELNEIETFLSALPEEQNLDFNAKNLVIEALGKGFLLREVATTFILQTLDNELAETEGTSPPPAVHRNHLIILYQALSQQWQDQAKQLRGLEVEAQSPIARYVEGRAELIIAALLDTDIANLIEMGLQHKSNAVFYASLQALTTYSAWLSALSQADPPTHEQLASTLHSPKEIIQNTVVTVVEKTEAVSENEANEAELTTTIEVSEEELTKDAETLSSTTEVTDEELTEDAEALSSTGEVAEEELAEDTETLNKEVLSSSAEQKNNMPTSTRLALIEISRIP